VEDNIKMGLGEK